MACHCKVQFRTVKRCVCAAALLLLLAGHTATLAYSYHRGMPSGGKDSGQFGFELLAGGVMLFSVLPLLALCCLVPEKTAFMCHMWFALHITWSDNKA